MLDNDSLLQVLSSVCSLSSDAVLARSAARSNRWLGSRRGRLGAFRMTAKSLYFSGLYTGNGGTGDDLSVRLPNDA